MMIQNQINSKFDLSFENMILKFQQEQDLNIKTCLVLKEGKEMGSFCNEPYSIDEKQLLFSMTKSFSSLAIGIACDKNYLSLDDKVIDIFPDKSPERPSANLKEMRVSDLLMMASGIHDNTYSELYPQHDWVEAFLKQRFLHKPGTYYRYSTHGSHMLSAIVEKKSGMNLLDFLDMHLFEPLKILRPHWETAPDGHIAGGMGLSLTTRDIAKVGQLLLNNGEYNGKQIISKEYLIKAKSSQIYKCSEKDKSDHCISGLEYGYQFHIDKNGNYRMDGAFGQLCLVLEKEAVVIVVTSINSKMESLLKTIYSSFNAEQLMNITYQKSVHINEEKKIATFNPYYKEYIFYPMTNNIKFLKIYFKVGYINVLTQKESGIVEFIRVDRDKLYQGKTYFVKDIQSHEQKYITKIIYESHDTLQFKIWYLETPYIVDFTLTENEGGMTVSYDINVSFNIKKFVVQADSNKMNQIQVNEHQIQRIASAIQGLHIKESYKNRDFIKFSASNEKKILAYLFCTAICHQTHHLINVDKNLIGWSYLEHVFCELAKKESEILDIDYIHSNSNDKLAEDFRCLFPRSNTDLECTLDDLDTRIMMIKNIAETIKDNYDNQVMSFIGGREIRLVDGNQGLYSKLEGLDAFRDPFKKKSTLFAKLLYQSDRVKILDEDRFEPLMDYHMQRLLLRTSCIDVLDEVLVKKLKNRELIESDAEIREACIQGIRMISNMSGVSILDLDDIFWAIGRSCCNQKILCRDLKCSKTPCTLLSIVEIEKHERCIFNECCSGRMNTTYQEFWEPQVKTTFY